MPFQIEMPQLSAEGESATLASWLVTPGDAVEKGDVIAELETDKATVELEAPASGTIVELSVAAGTEGLAPGALLGTIEADDAPSEADPASETPEIPEASDPASLPSVVLPPDSAAGPPVQSAAAPPATPLARRAAAQRGVDVAGLRGSGPGGRVVEADVLEAAAETAESSSSPPQVEAPAESPRAASNEASPRSLEAPFETRRLSAMRKTIARRLTESKQQVPHFYLRMRCPMDPVLGARSRLNAELASEGRATKLSLNDFIVRAAALALREVPEANVSFAGDSMRYYERVDVSVAVATDGGLVTPVVRDADRKGLTALAEEVKALAELAREGKLRPEQYQGGTFTISNLGMYGIETVYPILNPPQACILGVGAAEEQPVVRDGEIVVGRMAAFTLAADHRAVDGAVGARLMAALRERLEDPLGMML